MKPQITICHYRETNWPDRQDAKVKVTLDLINQFQFKLFQLLIVRCQEGKTEEEKAAAHKEATAYEEEKEAAPSPTAAIFITFHLIIITRLESIYSSSKTS